MKLHWGKHPFFETNFSDLGEWAIAADVLAIDPNMSQSTAWRIAQEARAVACRYTASDEFLFMKIDEPRNVSNTTSNPTFMRSTPDTWKRALTSGLNHGFYEPVRHYADCFLPVSHDFNYYSMEDFPEGLRDSPLAKFCLKNYGADCGKS